ncbi:hypothetical protein [Ehrlichia ruminantium]|nr:hypothetical protein [Ehrlichia ruminantium]QLK52835.1 hypothetical protein FDZ65_04285 [Ehrlichia ruminantium]QLK54526.1 hypothetical protein FDZ63_04285 [Ehrlichia ruminantium]QLK57277.1 hypothetical protein FDZ60_04295 [Ehrlichia ruminantium]
MHINSYTTHSFLLNTTFKQQLSHTSNKTLLPFLILISQTCKPPIDQEYSRYYHLIQHYTHVLYNKIQSTENIEQSVSLLRLWYQDLIYQVIGNRVLFPNEQYIIDKILNNTLDKMLIQAKPNNKLSHTCLKRDIYMKLTEKLCKADIRPELKKLFKNTIKNTYDITHHTINTMKIISTVTQNHDISLLLAFYGVSKRTNNTTVYPSTPMSYELKKIYGDIMQADPIDTQSALKLFPDKHTAHTIHKKLKTASTKVNLEYNKVYKFILYQYPWYSIINKIKQIIITITVIPKLREEMHILKRLRSTFIKSIAYGDTAPFFEKLANTRNTSTTFRKHNTTTQLIEELRKLETSTDNKTVTTQDFITHMKKYAIRPSKTTITEQLPLELQINPQNNQTHKKPNILSKTKNMIGKSKHFLKRTGTVLTKKMKKVVPSNRKKYKKVPPHLTSIETISEYSTEPCLLTNNMKVD